MTLMIKELALRYPGHPLFDVGVATVTAYSEKDRPEDVTEDDVNRFAKDLKRWYSRYPVVQRYISVIFTNSHFVQHAKSVEQKEMYADEMLFAYQHDTYAEEGDERCTFFPELAALKRATRQHIPLLNGEQIGNFGGMGQAGAPVSGLALLVIHAMPLGCWRVGNFLAFHQITAADNPGSMHYLAKVALDQHRIRLSTLVEGSKDGEMHSWGSYPRSRYVEALLQARSALSRRGRELHNLTGYYFTNYGPSPNVEILRLSNNVLDFIYLAQREYSRAWERVVALGWRRPRKDRDLPATPENTRRWRNNTYERLFDLPRGTRAYIQLLAQANEWELIELFLRKVLRMEQERIDVYRNLGDKLADYAIKYQRDTATSVYYDISRAKNYGSFRQRVRRIAEGMLRAGADNPLFTYDEFILAFEHPSDSFSQWKLGRDLIAFRMIERLHEHNIEVDLPVEDEIEEEE